MDCFRINVSSGAKGPRHQFEVAGPTRSSSFLASGPAVATRVVAGDTASVPPAQMSQLKADEDGAAARQSANAPGLLSPCSKLALTRGRGSGPRSVDHIMILTARGSGGEIFPSRAARLTLEMRPSRFPVTLPELISQFGLEEPGQLPKTKALHS